MAAKITLNHGTVQSYLDGENGVRELLLSRAQRVLAAAQSTAPVETGNFRDGLGIREDHTDRLAIRIGSSSPHAHLVEAKHGTMARALDSAGGS